MVSMSKQPMYHATCRKCGKQRMTLNPVPLCPKCEAAKPAGGK